MKFRPRVVFAALKEGLRGLALRVAFRNASLIATVTTANAETTARSRIASAPPIGRDHLARYPSVRKIAMLQMAPVQQIPEIPLANVWMVSRPRHVLHPVLHVQTVEPACLEPAIAPASFSGALANFTRAPDTMRRQKRQIVTAEAHATVEHLTLVIVTKTGKGMRVRLHRVPILYRDAIRQMGCVSLLETLPFALATKIILERRVRF